jgi:hypothetical protein
MQNPLAIPNFLGFSTTKITHSIPRRPISKRRDPGRLLSKTDF